MDNGKGEFAGTEPDGLGTGGSSGSPGGEPVDPATLTGNGPEQFDPAIHVGRDKRNTDGSYTRKRGRKAGSGSGGGRSSRSSGDLKSATEALTRTLVFLHVGIASATKTPEMVISEDEGKLLAEASVNVMREFDITPDPKAEAIIGMIVAAATVYGPRYYLVKSRKAEEKTAMNKAKPFEPSQEDKTEAVDTSSFFVPPGAGFSGNQI